MVCIAAAEAGDTSQDLKTGYLIGATPIKQRFAFFIGITVSTIAIGVTLNLMNHGLQEFRKPRAPGTQCSACGRGRAGEPPRARSISSPSRPPTAPSSTPPQERIHRPQRARLYRACRRQVLYSPQTGRIEVQWIPGIGSEKAAAPQARLMATVINGILSRKLPWGLGHARRLPGHRR